MTVAGQNEIDLRTAKRLYDLLDAGCIRDAWLAIGKTWSAKGGLWNPGDVPVRHNPCITDFNKPVGNRHPGERDFVGRGCVGWGG